MTEERQNTSVEDGAGTLEPPTAGESRLEVGEASNTQGSEAAAEGEAEAEEDEEEPEDEEEEDAGDSEDDADVEDTAD